MKTICCGTVFVFGYNAVCSVLKGLGDAKSPLCFVGIATIINVILDIILGLCQMRRKQMYQIDWAYLLPADRLCWLLPSELLWVDRFYHGVYYLRICCGINSLIYAAMYTLDSFSIGQYSGKLTSSVSGRTLSLVLFPHTGHRSHIIWPIKGFPPCNFFELAFFAPTFYFWNRVIGFFFWKGTTTVREALSCLFLCSYSLI